MALGAGGATSLAIASFEVATGRLVFVDAVAAAFVPLPLVHVVGAATGLAFSLRMGRASRRECPLPA